MWRTTLLGAKNVGSTSCEQGGGDPDKRATLYGHPLWTAPIINNVKFLQFKQNNFSTVQRIHKGPS